MTRARSARNAKNRVTNVRVVDENAGSDGAYVDRCISGFQNSHSSTSLLLEDSFAVNTATTATNAIIGGFQVRLFDDFVSLAAQFETCRVRAIRFDLYDVNPSNNSSYAWFSTFHDTYQSSAQPVFTAANVIDGPDSLIVPPGTGKASLYWRARGTQEMSFQTTDDAGVGFPPLDFGGLRYSLSAGTAGAKYQIVVKAVVDFRGRL